MAVCGRKPRSYEEGDGGEKDIEVEKREHPGVRDRDVKDVSDLGNQHW